ncbi:MAG: histidine triad nucleotide-binding protein [Calditrichaeota bacterium]|nr:histidine triad nucleotide-binding protein [Calditrichota bacterium]MCB9391150.1 histidine triad nucleotide-binding protein [Calditrichota bacterium]
MAETIFGRIIAGEIPADKILETEDLIAIRDINPQAPTHVLIIPKKPLKALSSTGEEDTLLLGKLLASTRKLAEQLGLIADGYRVVINNGESAGQSVPHLHIHLLGGRDFRWPPG